MLMCAQTYQYKKKRILVEVTQGPFVQNHFQISMLVFDKKIFKVLPLGWHGNQNSAWNGNPKDHSCEAM